MEIFFSSFAIFVAQPFLALVPAVVFLILARLRRSAFALVTGLVWIAYALYEAGMYARILCSGECNIRIDLLLIYPVLAILTVAAIVKVMSHRGAIT
jgi:hypothetical protein